jgi:hypothetical protein
MWIENSEYSQMPNSIKDSMNDIIADISVLEQSKNLSEKYEISLEKSKSNVTTELKRYLSIFNQRYLELMNLDYNEKLSPVFKIKIKAFVENLLIQGSSASDYLEWFFEDFARLECNKKYMPPTLIFTTKDWIINKYLFQKKDELSRRRGDLEKSQLKLKLVEMAKKMFEITKDENLGKSIISVANGTLPVTNFKKVVLQHAKKFNFEEILIELQE